MESNSIRLSELKVGVIINTSSGGCDLESEQKMLSILNRAGIVESKAWCGDAEEMERSFAEAAGQELEVLIVLGGRRHHPDSGRSMRRKGALSYPASRGNDEYAPSSLVW
jgi:hypothetical protein